METDAPVILVGNPNVGKSVIFAALTGRYVTVSNYPGTTVELTHGVLPDGTPVVDTPGTNSLSASSDDERVTADFLYQQIHRLRAVVQVADAKNLRRALLLTLQLAEWGVPLVLVLNMSDEAEVHGVHIDTARLSNLLGIPVIPAVATQGKGLGELAGAIEQARSVQFKVSYDAQLEKAIEQISALLPADNTARRGTALRLLGGDAGLAARFSMNGTLTAIQQQTAPTYDRPLRTVIISQQMQAAQAVLEQVMTVSETDGNRWVKRLGRWMVDPLLGWPFLLAVLWVVYKFVGEFGAGTLVGFLEKTVFGQWINPLATRIVDGLLPIPLIHDVLVGQYGVITTRLSNLLGIPVIPAVATQGKGLGELAGAIEQARSVQFKVSYDAQLEKAIEQISALLPADNTARRGTALRLLGGDAGLAARFSMNGTLTAIQQQTAPTYDRPLRTVIISQQMQAAQSLLEQVMTVSETDGNRWVKRLGKWMVDPLLGWPFLLAVLWVVYKFVGEFGAGTLVGFLEKTVFGQWINPLATRIVDGLLPIPLIHDVLVGQYGVITMALSYGIAIVLPIVATFFLAFSILEDTGYLPRLAIMFNRIFMMMGLNGKAVLPMVLGLGCDTMATMSTRILETRKERIMVTLLLVLGVPCSAQLGVILGMLGLVGSTGVFIWAGVVAATMILVGLLAAKLLPGESSDFILEIPPLRRPRLENITIKTLARVEWYLKEVLPLFIVGTLVLFVLDRTGVLRIAEQVGSPIVVDLLGLPAAATGAFLIGFLRRDYGAAGLFALALSGQLNPQQVVVSLIVVTLFIPCIANVLMIIKEYGWRVTVGVVLTVFPLAFAVGGIVNAAMNLLHVVP